MIGRIFFIVSKEAVFRGALKRKADENVNLSILTGSFF